MRYFIYLLLAFSSLAGCVSNPNSIWFEGAMMNYEILEVGPRQYKLVASGAGLHKKEEVERGFLSRASQLCGGQDFSHDYKTIPYQYGSSGGGYSFTHNAFKTTGIVICK
jgi:hypothetical protein